MEGSAVKTDEFVEIGKVYVDAGCVAVGDPSYLAEVEDWADAASSTFVDERYGKYGAFGMVVSSGIGDGAYTVSVRYEDVPGFGRRIAEMRVLFIDDRVRQIAEVLTA